MKKTISYCLLAATLTGGCLARTWTSADGTKTFEGDFVSGDDESVTVKKNGKQLTFKLNILSEADQTWTKEAVKNAALEEANKEAAEGFADTDLGKFLKKTQTFNGKSYKKQSLEGAPEYFLLYYSASW